MIGEPMPVSVFELFKIGIGPSSSHTVGPMLAAHRFLNEANSAGVFGSITEVTIELFGSLALTGRGHGTDRAVLLGLAGELPDKIDVDSVAGQVGEIERSGQLHLLGRHSIAFDERRHLLFHQKQSLPRHPNGLRFAARSASGEIIHQRDYYSIGGGFVIAEGEEPHAAGVGTPLPYPYGSAEDLLAMAASAGLTIDEIVLANEVALRSPDEVRGGLDRIWSAMQACIDRGLQRDGELPGPFRVRRRAPALYRRLTENYGHNEPNRPLHELEWVTTFAIAL